MSDKKKFENNRTKERISFDCIECISCKTTIHRYEDGFWANGSVDNISVGYGSIHDGSVFKMGICDQCISIKVDDGNIFYMSDMFGHEELMKSRTDKWDKIRKSKLRELNIDKLSK